MSRRVRFEPVHASSIPVVEPVIEEALAIVQDAESELGVSDYRECSRCGDDVLTLSSRDWCDGCEEEVDGLVFCPNFGAYVERKITATMLDGAADVIEGLGKLGRS